MRSGAITAAQLEVALREQSSWGGRLGLNLLALGFLGEAELAAAIAAQFGLPVVDLDREPPPAEATRLIPVFLAERHGIIPLGVEPGGRLRVACIDPTNNAAMTEVREVTGLVPEPSVTTPAQLERTIRRAYYGESQPGTGPDPRLQVSHRMGEGTETGRPPATDGELVQRVEELMELLKHKKRGE